jgi:outer membrane lipoprotein-sorting protein
VKYTATILALLFISVSWSNRNDNDPKIQKILHQMYDSIKNIKTLRQKVKALERIESKYTTANSEIKVLTHPKKIYFINPSKKLEVLYDSEVSVYKAYVKPNVFPYMTLSLDPTGNIMRKNQHYTILELGYEFIGKSIALTISKDKEGLRNFTYHGKVMKNGYNCHFLEYDNKSYAYTTYTVGEKETVSVIAYKLCVNDFLLRNKNNLLNEFGYLKKGTVLKVPTLYCKRAILYIDDKLYLPVAIHLYDDKGLFESYEYTDIEINKPFKPDEFKKENKEYGF